MAISQIENNSTAATEQPGLKKASLEKMLPYLAMSLGLQKDQVLQGFRPARLEDLPKILHLRQKTLGAGLAWDDELFWRWKYLDQPKLKPGEIPCWVFEKGSEILGAMGFERVDLQVNEQTFPAIWSFDIMVHPEYEGRGLGVLMNLLFQERFPFLMVLGTNDRSTGMLERLFARLPSLPCWKKVIKTRPFIKKRLGFKTLSSTIGLLFDPALMAIEHWRKIQLPDDLEFRGIETFDESFEALEHSQKLLCGIKVRRDRHYLNWKFTRNPRWQYRNFAAYKSNQLQGYVVTHLSEGAEQLDGCIVDWEIIRSGTGEATCAAALRAQQWMIQHAIDELRRLGVDGINLFTSDSSLQEALKAMGFFRVPAGDIPFFVGACPAELQNQVLEGLKWRLTKGDSDIG